MKNKIKNLNSSFLTEGNRKYINDLMESIKLRQSKLKTSYQTKRKSTTAER